MKETTKRLSDETTSRFNVEKVVVGMVYALAFLAPFFFIPVKGISVALSKGILITAVTIIAAVLLLVYTLIRGEITIPKGPILYGAIAVVLVTLLSAIFSSASKVSFVGYGLETDTFGFIAICFALMMLVASFFQSQRRVFYLYGTLLLSFGILAIIHIVRLFAGPEVLTLGVLFKQTATLVGGWNDLAIFSGLIVLLAVLTVEFFSPARSIKIILYMSSMAGLFFLIVINFYLVWVILGLIALIILLYIVSFAYWDSKNHSFKQTRKIPIFPLAIFIISVVFIFVGGHINRGLSKHMDISYTEIRPSTQSTVFVIKQAFKKNPILGVGPNRFSEEWELSKPANIVGSVFRDVSFKYGIGYIPTILVTTGLFGLLAWLGFLVAFGYQGARAIADDFKHPISRYFVVSSFLASVYLWGFALVYTPSNTMIMLAFLFTGATLSMLVLENKIAIKDVSFMKDPRASFFGILSVLLLLAVLFIGAYTYTKKFSSWILFEKGLRVIRTEVDEGSRLIERAAFLGGSDFYYRVLSRIRIEQLSLLLTDQNISSGELQARTELLLSQSLGYAESALAYDDTEYLNWIVRGNAYGAMTQLRISGAIEQLFVSYKKASELNPLNSTLATFIVQLESQIAGNAVRTPSELIETSQSIIEAEDPIEEIENLDEEEGPSTDDR